LKLNVAALRVLLLELIKKGILTKSVANPTINNLAPISKPELLLSNKFELFPIIIPTTAIVVPPASNTQPVVF
jgi:hypothetical protein